MKKNNVLSTLIKNEFYREKNKYFIVISFYFLGILFGTIGSVYSNSDNKINEYVTTFLSSYSLHGTIPRQVFSLAFFNYIKFIFFLWASGWYIWLFPLCFLQVFTKGFRIGFTISCFVQCLSFRGILLSIITLLPQNIIFLPALFFFSVYQFQFLSERKLLISGKNLSSKRKQCYLKNMLFLFILIVVSILCSLMEGYLIPALLQMFSKLFG